MAAEKADPGSGHPRMLGMIRRWAVLLIGSSSVMPWTIPSTMMRQAPSWAKLMLTCAASVQGAGPNWVIESLHASASSVDAATPCRASAGAKAVRHRTGAARPRPR